MMRPIISVVSSPRLCALAILLVGAARASAQERPAGSATAAFTAAAPGSAHAWSDYRPGTAWAPGHADRAAAGPSTPRTRAAATSPAGAT